VATPVLTPDQIAQIAGLVSDYISNQRKKYVRCAVIRATQGGCAHHPQRPPCIELVGAVRDRYTLSPSNSLRCDNRVFGGSLSDCLLCVKLLRYFGRPAGAEWVTPTSFTLLQGHDQFLNQGTQLRRVAFICHRNTEFAPVPHHAVSHIHLRRSAPNPERLMRASRMPRCKCLWCHWFISLCV